MVTENVVCSKNTSFNNFLKYNYMVDSYCSEALYEQSLETVRTVTRCNTMYDVEKLLYLLVTFVPKRKKKHPMSTEKCKDFLDVENIPKQNKGPKPN